MLVSEFNINNPPPLPASLADTDSVNQYLVDVVSHAQFVAEKIDELEYDGKHRQQRIYSFQITRFPNLEFSIRIPTRHHYYLENLGLPEIVNNSVLDNSMSLDNNVVLMN